MSNDQKDSIFSIKIPAGKRSYFIDIKKTSKDDFYLKISESKRIEKDDYEHHHIMIFNEDIDRFIDSFSQTINKLKELQQAKEKQKTGKKQYSFEIIRKTHSEAYKPWTAENDQDLEQLLHQGKKVKELSLIFSRKEGAISSRIKKLGLKKII